MKGGRLGVAGIAVAATLVGAAPAGATTFCVPAFHPACPNNGINVELPSLETAVNTNAADGVADTVRVNAVTVTNPDPISLSGSDALLIQGAGPAATTITTSSAGNDYVLNLIGDSRAVTVRDLTIAIPATAPDDGGAGVQLSGDTLDNVDIISLNPGPSGSIGVTGWQGGATLRNGEIRSESGGALSRGISAGGITSGIAVIENMTVRDAASGLSFESPTAISVVRRSSILDSTQVAVSVSGGGAAVENSVITTLDSFPVSAAIPPGSSNDANLVVDHTTMINTGTGNLAPLQSNVSPAATGGESTLTATNVLARGYDSRFLRQGQPVGDANLNVRYSNLAPTGTSTGNGTLIEENNFEADPLFADAAAGNFRLLPGSPSIDAGDPAAGGVAEDFDSAPRPTDGDGDGVARRDQGAFEYQPPQPPPPPDTVAPETSIDKGPGKKRRRGKAKFRFSADEAGSSFECKLDKKAYKACTSPRTYKRLKRGKHRFSVRATDVAGNLDASSASVKFKVPRR